MASQLYTAVPNDVITAARWNNEFGNLYDNVLFDTLISTGTTTTRTVAERFSDIINAKDFGAVGNGVADDTTAIAAAIAYVAAQGKTLLIPAGTYNLTAALLVSAAAAPFHIIGEGSERTILKRNSNYSGTVLEIRSSNDWSIRDLSIDGGQATYTSGNHGIAFRDCSRVHILRVFVYNYNNSGIIGFPLTDGVATHGDNVIEQCTADGENLGAIGIMVASQYRTRFINCVAKNIDSTGDPGYAIQFKNNCRDCVMINPQVFTARMGIVISNDLLAADDSFDNHVYGGYAYNCALTGVDLAGVNRAGVYDVTVDMNAQGNDAVSFSNATHCEARFSTIDVQTPKACAKFSDAALDNYAFITSMAQPAAAAKCYGMIVSDAASFRNRCVLNKVTTPTITGTTVLYTNASDSTNTFETLDISVRDSYTIATGAITLLNGKARHVTLDTELAAASDDLDTISGGTDYQIVTFVTLASGRDTVMKHNTGNILLTGAADFTLSNAADTLTLMYRSAISKWVEVGRGDNS